MDKKNTLLLTVIAIATLLVAVVGATFAYFSAQQGEGQSAQLNVTTASSDLGSIQEMSQLYVTANQQNFEKENQASIKGETTGKVSFTANGTVDSKYCYKVDLKITSNNFIYSLEEAESKPELILSISKNGQEATDNLGDSGSSQKTLTYKDSVLSSAKVCKQVGATPITPQQLTDGETCTDGNTIKGYDITTLEALSTISIPDFETSHGDHESKEFVHQINATKGATVSDDWTASITFVNYDADQQKNTNHSLIGTLDFTPVDCTTGNPFES